VKVPQPSQRGNVSTFRVEHARDPRARVQAAGL
jgi:hypothetical protein